jgi:hypothetical protein
VTPGLILLFYPIAVGVVVLLQVFGNVQPDMNTVIGTMITLFFGTAALFVRGDAFTYELRHRKRWQLMGIILCGLIALWLVVVVARYGRPSALYLLSGEIPPLDVLYGKYRDRLPLRAFVAPLMIGIGVTTYLTLRRDLLSRIAATVTAITMIAVVAIYETRHVLIWTVFYMFLVRYPFARDLRSILRAKTLVFVAVAFFLFVGLGNLRSGIGFADSKRFADANEVSAPYSQAPLGVLWVLIYSLSGVSRGIANDLHLSAFNFELPEKFFPGPLQSLAGKPFADLNPRFEAQQFAIDGWHTLCLYFGAYGAALVLVSFLCVYLGYSLWFVDRLNAGRRVSPLIAAMGLWLGLRVALLPFGEYIFDFAALSEWLYLALFSQLAGISFVRAKPL